MTSRARYWGVAAGVVVLDQITKQIVDRVLRLHDDVPLIDGILSFQYVRNTGAAFGVLSNANLPYQDVLLSVISLLALGAIVFYALRLPATHRLPQVALSLVMGGAVGNLLDRARLGYVIDFVLVQWRNHRWPNFNLADSAISVGIALLILDVLRTPHRERSQPKLSEPATTRME